MATYDVDKYRKQYDKRGLKMKRETYNGWTIHTEREDMFL